MSAAVLAILLAAPCAARKPAPTAEFVKVDLIVINRVRSHHVETEFDYRWRAVERHVYTETWWISFWDKPFAALLPLPGAWIDRGWWQADALQNISRGPDGWILESKDGLNVIGRELWIIDSPFDWEVRMRRVYQPIRRP